MTQEVAYRRRLAKAAGGHGAVAVFGRLTIISLTATFAAPACTAVAKIRQAIRHLKVGWGILTKVFVFHSAYLRYIAR